LANFNKKALIAWGLSIQATLELVVGILVGIYIDKRTGKEPLFFIIGLIIGLFASIKDLIALVRFIERDDGNDGEK